MTRRLTLTLDEDLEQAIEEAPRLLDVSASASESEKLRAYARLGYEASLERELERERLATYRRWADEPELVEVARATFRTAARRRVHQDG